MRYGVTAETVCPCFMHTKERLVTEILESVGAFFRANIWTPVSSMTWKDGLDILLLAVLFYFLYSFVSVRRAGKLLFGGKLQAYTPEAVTLGENGFCVMV